MNHTPKTRALEWWREHAERGEYVVGKAALPGAAASRFLRAGGYILEVGGGIAWILARPLVDALPDALYPNYWRVVRVVLEAYAPAVVERTSAVRLYVDQFTAPERLSVRQGANASNRVIELVPGHEIVIRPGPVELDQSVERRPFDVPIAVDDPAETLLGLPIEYLRDDPEAVAVWIKSLVVARPALDAAYARRPRPVVLKRLGRVAREVGNDRLADQVDEVLASEYSHFVGRSHTDRGPAFAVPAYVAGLRTTHNPWLDRQAATFARFRDQVEARVEERERSLRRFDRAELLGQARAAKAYDAYHSTTIEGYRISPDEVSAVIRGVPVGGHDPEEVRARMAVAGYARAFELVLGAIREAPGRLPIDLPLIQRLYLELFGPSVDAGIVPVDLLRGWRAEPAYLRGQIHVPPGPEKVPQLMAQYEALVNGIEARPIARAVLAHLEFVTIHPYADGNGRLARFLMNAALLGEGLPWVTIRNDDRSRYFAALREAQVNGDPTSFTDFVMAYVRKAVETIGKEIDSER
ncbi:MAG TPA: Fic family protein [Longimicrobium sp.]|nr:Fic family protein [Longimicrobium sp.]